MEDGEEEVHYGTEEEDGVRDGTMMQTNSRYFRR